jgi:hypothetical protein
MKSIYSALRDDVGLGQHCVIQGDHVISPNYSTPSLLNMLIIDGVDECGGDSTMHFTENDACELLS